MDLSYQGNWLLQVGIIFQWIRTKIHPYYSKKKSTEKKRSCLWSLVLVLNLHIKKILISYTKTTLRNETASNHICCYLLVQTLLRQFIQASSAKCIRGVQGIQKTCPAVSTHHASPRQLTSFRCSFFEFPKLLRKAFMEASSLQDSESFRLERVWQHFYETKGSEEH